MTLRKNFLAASVSFAAIAVAAPGNAVAEDNGASSGDVIIVTGQKREERVQDVPAAVTAFSGDNLEEQAVERFDDLQFVAPSLSITDAGLTQSVNIRGVGLASGSPNASNGVATYVDGVFQPPIVSTNSFYDIGSVEVFRGPQGTFVGSNSTGGAIFINSRNPELDGVGGYLNVEGGNYARYGGQGALNVPMSDTLAVRAAGIYRKRSSYYTNSPGVNRPGSLEELGGRLGVFWKPTESFDALFKAELADKETGGYAYRPTLGTRYEAFRTNDIRVLNYSDSTRNDERNAQFTGRLQYTTHGGVVIRGISGYQNKRINNFYDNDATNAATLPAATQDQFVREKVFTGELNIISPSGMPFRWIVGGYFQRNNILVDISNNPASPVHVDVDLTNKKTTTGLFAQMSYDLTDRLSVDLGGRYSTYDIDGFGAVTLAGPGIFLADAGGFYNEGVFTGKAALNYKVNDDHLVYAFVARGYKAGGFSSPATSFDPETVLDYELGWKGSFIDGAITTQLGAFWYDYNDFQQDAIDIATGRASLINLTDATVKGFEGQIQARAGGLEFSGGFAFTDSSLSGIDYVDGRSFSFDNPSSNNLPQCMPGQTMNCADYTPYIVTTAGGPNLYSPKWTVNASVAYTIALSDTIEVTPRLSYSHIGDRFTYIAYDPVRDSLPAFDLLNFSLGADLGDYGIEFWMTNLTDEEYSSGQRQNNEFYGAPREYGVRARVDF